MVCFNSSSLIILPCSISTTNILPGCKRPFSRIKEGSTGNTPVSDAIITLSSFVTQYLEGRKPFLSNVAPIIFPSVKEIEAGPSQGSIIQA